MAAMPLDECYGDSEARITEPGQMPRFGADSGVDGEWLPRPRAALLKLTCVDPNITDTDQAIAAAKKFIAAALSNQRVKLIKDALDVQDVSTANIGLLFGMQHAPDNLAYADLMELARIGVRSMALAYDGTSMYGGGCYSGAHLLMPGMRLIERMAKLGIILDLSDANQQTAYAALEFIRKEGLSVHPMLSHSGCQAIYPHLRNAQDRVIEAVGELGGYLGIPCTTSTLAPKGADPWAEFTRHLTHAVMKLGMGKVGIGSDCPHVDMDLDGAKARYERQVRASERNGSYRAFFPDRPIELIEHGSVLFKIVAAKLKDSNVLMHDRGILGANFRRFLSEALRKSQ